MKSLRLLKVFTLVFVSTLIPFLNVYATGGPTNEGVATASEVFVVYNSSYTTDSNSDTVQDSLEIANYYKNTRSIPSGNVVGVAMPTTEVITRSEYDTYVKAGIEAALTNSGLASSIKYIVLTKGVPLKITDTTGNNSNPSGDYASVDSSVTLLYQTYTTTGRISNPYYNVATNFDLSYRFETNTFTNGTGQTLKYLVTRLDGYTVPDIKGMIDRAFAPDTSGAGYFVLDGNSGVYNYHFDQMSTASSTLNSMGKNTYPYPYTIGNVNITSAPGPLMGYTSYGYLSNLPNNYYNNVFTFSYLNGAITSTYESFSAFTMTSPDTTNHGQLAQFIHAGGSGAIGNAYEPYSDAVAHEDIWMVKYSSGYTFADSAYMSLRYLDWTGVVLGDPLMKIVIGDNTSAPTVTTGSSSSITTTTVTLAGNITNTGGETNTIRGVQYGLTSSYGSTSNTSGSYSTGSFTINLTGLSCETTYHYRAYSHNSAFDGYGSDSTFTTSDCVTPSVTASSATSVGRNSATLNGNIVDAGIANPTVRGFEYGLTTSYGSTTSSIGSYSTGTFNASVSSLTCETTYHYRAFATNTSGTSYSSDITFNTTTCSTEPTIVTGSSSAITDSAATIAGSMTDSGGADSTVRGFEYGLDANYGSSTTNNGTFGTNFVYQLQWGVAGTGNGEFDDPYAVAVDSTGAYVYVLSRHRVQKFDSDGNYITSWGSFGSGNGQFNYPTGIAVDSSGNVYVSDNANYRVQKFDSSGNYITKWGTYSHSNGGLTYPQGIALDSSNYVYVTDDYDNYRLQKFSSTGTFQFKTGSYGSGDGQFNNPRGVAVDSSGNIYVADHDNNRVQKFNSSGVYQSQFGSYGLGNGQFTAPVGIDFDSSGNIYVTDASRVQKFNSSGVYQSQFGSYGTGDGEFDSVAGIAIDSSDNIYLADSLNDRVQKFGRDLLFSDTLSGLVCNTTYHYRAYSTNNAGTGYGSDQTFTTEVCPPDVTPPTITDVSSDKSNGSYTVGDVVDLDITFSEEVNSTGNVTVTLETGATDRTCTLTVTSSTTGTCNYTVQAGDTTSDLTVISISGVINDTSSNTMSDFAPATNLASNKDIVIDTTLPTVSTLSPTDGASGTAINSNLVITFDQAVYVGTGNITIKKTSDNSTIETIDISSGQVTGTGTNTITINPSSDFSFSTSYYIQIGASALEDLAGNSYAGIANTTTWNFTAIAQDPNPPVVSSFSPTDNATGILPTANLIVTFNEDIVVQTGNITIKKASNNSTVEIIDITSNQVTGTGTDTIAIDPSAVLDFSTNYYVQISLTAIDDLAGNSYAGISNTTTWNFTTSSNLTPTVLTSTPSNINSGSATLNGNISILGGSNATIRGFNYGPTTSYGTTTIENGSFSSGLYSSIVSGLGCGTYHYRAYVTNSYGTSYGSDVAFNTSSCPSNSGGGGGGSGGNVNNSLKVLSITSNPSDKSVNINWQTNRDSSSRVFYGLTSVYNKSTVEYDTLKRTKIHSISINGLECGKIYHYTVVSRDSSMVASNNLDNTFKTNTCTNLSSNVVKNTKKNLQYKENHPEVKELQKFLNNSGYIVAKKGAGSKGKETTYFGIGTKSALIKFQKNHGIPATGVLGTATRSLIATISNKKSFY